MTSERFPTAITAPAPVDNELRIVDHPLSMVSLDTLSFDEWLNEAAQLVR